jgi:hypothetical protein
MYVSFLSGNSTAPEASAKAEARYQFDLSAIVPKAFGTKEERLAYFALDADSKPDRLVFNRTIMLKDTWTKIEKKSNW